MTLPLPLLSIKLTPTPKVKLWQPLNGLSPRPHGKRPKPPPYRGRAQRRCPRYRGASTPMRFCASRLAKSSSVMVGGTVVTDRPFSPMEMIPTRRAGRRRSPRAYAGRPRPPPAVPADALLVAGIGLGHSPWTVNSPSFGSVRSGYPALRISRRSAQTASACVSPNPAGDLCRSVNSGPAAHQASPSRKRWKPWPMSMSRTSERKHPAMRGIARCRSAHDGPGYRHKTNARREGPFRAKRPRRSGPGSSVPWEREAPRKRSGERPRRRAPRAANATRSQVVTFTANAPGETRSPASLR
jgi:hypothetical protein